VGRNPAYPLRRPKRVITHKETWRIFIADVDG
jgi:hypothetical protein